MNQTNKEFMRTEYSKFWLDYNANEILKADDIERLSILRNLAKDKTVLDVGCGGGFPYFDTLAELGTEITGTDISKEACDTVQVNHPNHKIICVDFEKNNFESKSFDIVFCFRTFRYFPNQVKALNEMIRIAKKYVVFEVRKPSIFEDKMKKRRKLPKIKNIPYYLRLRIRNPIIFNTVINGYETKTDVKEIEKILRRFKFEKINQEESFLYIVKL